MEEQMSKLFNSEMNFEEITKEEIASGGWEVEALSYCNFHEKESGAIDYIEKILESLKKAVGDKKVMWINRPYVKDTSYDDNKGKINHVTGEPLDEKMIVSFSCGYDLRVYTKKQEKTTEATERIIPEDNYILVEMDAIETKTASGIITTTNTKREEIAQSRGLILDIGAGAFGYLEKPEEMLGKRVIIKQFNGTIVNDEPLKRLIQDSDVIGTIEEVKE